MRYLVLAAALLAAVTIGVAAAAGAFNTDSHPRPVAAAPAAPGPGSELTKNVPCDNSHQRLIGPKTLRRFHAVTAVSCIDGTRTYPGQGQWSVRVRRVAVGGVAGLQRYFEQPSRRDLPKGEGCLEVARFILVPTFVDAEGQRLVPRTPVDACGPLPGDRKAARGVHWHVVSVHKLKLMVSAAALAAHCAMGIKDLPAGGIGPVSPTSGGRVLRKTPRTMRVCIYRTEDDFQIGRFVRGFRLGAPQIRRLLAAVAGPAPSRSCPDQRRFATFGADETWAEVELGGCFRVGRTYPDYGIGSADPAVVRAILGVR